MKKYEKQDQRILAEWAMQCAERVLTYFEKAYPGDDRPRKAIDQGRKWMQTGFFKMSDIRGASLSSHAAAKLANKDSPGFFAAHAAGQAMATAHVPQHAFGASYYALRAIVAADPVNAEENASIEHGWMAGLLPDHLREEFLKRIVIIRKGKSIQIVLRKDADF